MTDVTDVSADIERSDHETRFSLNEPFDITGSESKATSGEFYFLQFAAPRHRVDGLNFQTEHCRDLFCFEQLSFLPHLNHSVTIKDCLLFVASIAANEED